MRKLDAILKGIALASVPLIGLHGCSSTGDCGGAGRDLSVFPLSAEEVNAISAAMHDGRIPVSSAGDGTITCDHLCQPPAQRDAGADETGWFTNCAVGSSSDGQPTIECWRPIYCEGRRPEAYAEGPSKSPCVTGAWLARMAQLEAASVPAFRRLRAELMAHGAPVELIRATEQAIREERRHTHTVGELARAHGATWAKPEIEALFVRDLEAVALENAIEGCVHETFGAMQAHWQAQAAQDPAVREAMQVIAEEETRHAELAWAVDAWAMAQLSPEAQARIEAARQKAIAALEGQMGIEAPSAVVEQLGVPSAHVSMHLFEQMRTQVWASAV